MSDDFETDDRRLRDLYREAAGDGPPAALDQRILAAAASAADRRSRRLRLPGRGPLAGLATAAVVVLAVTLLLRQVEAPPPAVEEASSRPGELGRQAAEAVAGDSAAPPRSAADTADVTDAAQRKSTLIGPRADGAVAPAAPAPRRRELDAPARPAVAPPPTANDETAGSWTGVSEPVEARGPARLASTAFAAPGCPEPYPLPEGATLGSRDDGGLDVNVNGEHWILHCRDGVWQREPGPGRPPDDGPTGDGTQSNR